MEMRVHRWIFIGKILAENDAIIILSYECLTGIPGRAGGGVARSLDGTGRLSIVRSVRSKCRTVGPRGYSNMCVQCRRGMAEEQEMMEDGWRRLGTVEDGWGR